MEPGRDQAWSCSFLGETRSAPRIAALRHSGCILRAAHEEMTRDGEPSRRRSRTITMPTRDFTPQSGSATRSVNVIAPRRTPSPVSPVAAPHYRRSQPLLLTDEQLRRQILIRLAQFGPRIARDVITRV